MNNDIVQFQIENLQESLDVEVKNWLNGLGTNDDKARLAKEIIALANHGGGYIFIGFADENESGQHEAITPADNEADAFTQDVVSSVVERFIEPACQCRLGYFTRQDGEISHPVIFVPGEHRTPVWAKRGNDAAGLRQQTVYVRGVGAQSRPPINQNEWEELIGRLVKARQGEMLSSIRDILNPSKFSKKPEVALIDWVQSSKEAWQEKLESLPEGSPHRLNANHWNVSFKITPFHIENIVALSEKLDRETPKHSGWPPFTYLHREPISPKPYKNGIEAWRLDVESEWRIHSDFWRIDESGFGFMARPYQEDEESYCSSRVPRPVKPCFDWLLPSYRLAEIFKFVERLASYFSDEQATVEMRVEYNGMRGRRLECHEFGRFFHTGAKSTQETIENTISFSIGKVETNLEELVLELLSPVYAQFEFSKLREETVNEMVADALSYNG